MDLVMTEGHPINWCINKKLFLLNDEECYIYVNINLISIVMNTLSLWSQINNDNEIQWMNHAENSDINLLGVRVRFLISSLRYNFAFWGVCDKLQFYDSFSHHSSFLISLILICKVSFENGLKSCIQWYNSQNNQMNIIEMIKVRTNLPSNHLKPQMYDSVTFRLNIFREIWW